MSFADIAIPSPLHTAFTYAVPHGMRLAPGMRVIIPFRRKQVVGIALELHETLPKACSPEKLKQIETVLDETPSLSPKLLDLIRWISQYYSAPIGEVCRTALPTRLFQREGTEPSRTHEPHELRASSTPLQELNAAQAAIAQDIGASLKKGSPQVFLLHGITGSGKTEIYLHLFSSVVAQQKQGLLLVPEIGLTSQLTERIAATFGKRVAVYHSDLTDAQRHAQWLRIQSGDVDVVIGTRSALFAPLPAPGLIVVDEEHDTSFKQDEGLTYHARDAAVMRGHQEGLVTVLGSATPSLESFSNAKQGKYRYHHLSMRATGASLPDIEVVDMRQVQQKAYEKKEEYSALSPTLRKAIADRLDRQEQTLLFLGRRGFANALQCASCGDVFRCPNCDIALTTHVQRHQDDKLECHYCDYRRPTPSSCPSCQGSELSPVGQGTQRLEAELQDFFPTARIARLDSDIAAKTSERRRILKLMQRGEIDILVGTQMVTKGHDFPRITLVGVVSADQSLHLPDFRSAERTFQLLTQVAGRAGRGTLPGEVIIQSLQPEHVSISCARLHDGEAFYAQELEHRKALRYPPFTRLANLRLSSIHEQKVASTAELLARVLRDHSREHNDVQILGPAPAPLTKLRGRFRWQILIKAPSSSTMTQLITSMRPRLEERLPRTVRLSIDVDPVKLL